MHTTCIQDSDSQSEHRLKFSFDKRLNQAIAPHLLFYSHAVTMLDQVHIKIVNVTLMRRGHHGNTVHISDSDLGMLQICSCSLSREMGEELTGVRAHPPQSLECPLA